MQRIPPPLIIITSSVATGGARDLTGGTAGFTKVGKGGGEIDLTDHTAAVRLEPRGRALLAVDGLSTDSPAHRVPPPPKPSAEPGSITVEFEKNLNLRAAAIQMVPGPWDVYASSTAASGSPKEISLEWRIGDQTGTIKDPDYPYGFSIPVPAGETRFTFRISGIKVDGTAFQSNPAFIVISP